MGAYRFAIICRPGTGRWPVLMIRENMRYTGEAGCSAPLPAKVSPPVWEASPLYAKAIPAAPEALNLMLADANGEEGFLAGGCGMRFCRANPD